MRTGTRSEWSGCASSSWSPFSVFPPGLRYWSTMVVFKLADRSYTDHMARGRRLRPSFVPIRIAVQLFAKNQGRIAWTCPAPAENRECLHADPVIGLLLLRVFISNG